MYAQLPNTVRAQRSRPLLSNRDISGNNMKQFYEQLLSYFDKNMANPISIGETAVTFYLLNHGIALLDGSVPPDQEMTPTQENLYNTYHDCMGKIGVRMVYDIVFMLTAMASTTHPDDYHLEFVETHYGKDAREFISGIVANTGNVSYWTPNFSTLKPVLEKAKTSASNIDIGRAIRALGYILDVRQRELSYGPLWRDIARMATSFFEGAKTLETTIDTSFTFCHCNGSFFEKGKLFSPVGNELFKALDIQRSGQIPQFVKARSNSLTKSKEIQELHHLFAKEFPEVFNAKVDHSIVKEVTRNQLVFTQKYQHHWNSLGAAQQQHHEPPKPKIFSPIDEEGYMNLTKGL